MAFEQDRAALLDMIATLFDDNITEDVTPADLRQGLNAIVYSTLLKSGDALSVNQLRGGTHIKSTLAGRNAIVINLRVVGMSCIVANPGTGLGEGGSQSLSPVAATFVLTKDSNGNYDAFADADSTQVVKASWVLATGTETEKLATYPEFVASRRYEAGDPIQYTFPNGSVRLFKARKLLAGAQNPPPTGLDNDPNWVAFAPLATASAYTDAQAVAAVLAASGRGLNELLLPQQVQAGKWYMWSSGIFEARSTFQASAAPVAGPNWRLVVAFSSYGDAQAVAAVVASGLFAPSLARCVLIKADGQRLVFSTFGEAAVAMSYGDSIQVYGYHDYGNAVLGLDSSGSIYMAPGSTLKAGQFYSPNVQSGGLFLHVSGPGKIEIPIFYICPGCANFSMRNTNLKGQLNFFSYPDTLPNRKAVVKGCFIDSGATPPILVTYANGGYYATYVQLSLYENQISTTSAGSLIKFVDSAVKGGGNPNHPAAEANNLLRVVGNVFSAPAGCNVVDDSEGRFAFEQGVNNYIGGCAGPAKVAANTLTVFPAPGGGGSTTPPKPAAPVFVGIDDETNEAIFQKDPDVPAAGYLFTLNSAATFENAGPLPILNGQFRIPVGSGALPVGSVGMRVAAAGATPASNITYASVEFTQDGLFRNDSFNNPATGNSSTGWVLDGPSIANGILYFPTEGILAKQKLRAFVAGIPYRMTAKGRVLTAGNLQLLTGSGGSPNGQSLVLNDADGIVFYPNTNDEVYFITRNGMTCEIDELRVVPA